MLKELFDEPISEEEFEELVGREGDALSAVEIRRLLIRLRQIDRDRAKVKEIRDAVVASYAEKIGRFDADEKRTRESLYAFCRVHGTASFPDVGSAYLSSQGPKIEVQDSTRAKNWSKAQGYTKLEADITAAKKALLANGEVPPEESGMVFQPPHEILVVRAS